MALFTSTFDFTVGGYKTVFKKYSWLPFAIEEGGVKIPPPDIPYQADVRGVLPSGMVPSKTLSYRIYWKVIARNTLSTTSPLSAFTATGFTGGLTVASFVASLIPGVNLGVSYPSVGVVIFEGKDVVDLSTEGLIAEDYSRPNQTASGSDVLNQTTDGQDVAPGDSETESTGASSAYFIEVPDKIYLAVHAGENKLIPEEDSKGFPYWSSIASNGPLQGNLSKGFVKITDSATDDTLVASGGTGVGRDVSSRMMLVQDGEANFVSYIAASKLLFKDVIETRVSAFTFGYYQGVSELAITDTVPGNIEVLSILRYSYLPPFQDENTENQDTQEDTEVQDEPSSDPQEGFVWRLTESINVTIENKIDKLSQEDEELLSVEDRAMYGSDQLQKHYVYDLNESGSDFSDSREIRKTGYIPILAKLKSEPSSNLRDDSFKSNILPIKKGLALGSIDFQAVDVFGSTQSDVLTGDPSPEIYYTSPLFEYNFSQRTRIGFEHYGQIQDSFGSGALDFRLLARSKDDISGLSCCYDTCLTQASLFSSSNMGVLERTFDDRRWTRHQIDTPTGANLPMMTGEFPFRTEGQCVLIPPEKEISFSVKDNNIEFKDSLDIVTSVAFRSGSIDGGGGLDIPDFQDTFKFYNSKDTNAFPTQEISLGGMALKRGQVLFGIFPARPVRYEAGGGLREIEHLFGIKRGDNIAEAFPLLGSLDAISLQQQEVRSMQFPNPTSNISSALDCVSGLYFIAFENENRIDLAIRQSPFERFAVIRDVIRRVPDDQSADDTNSILESKLYPPVTLPWLMVDNDIRNLYLFFVYKTRIFCKKIPYELFISGTNEKGNSRYTVKEEKDLARRIMSIQSCMSLDPAMFRQTGLSSFSNLRSDFAVSNLKVLIPEKQNPVVINDKMDSEANVEQYSVAQDAAGYMYNFAQVGNRIMVARSANNGEEWENIIGYDSILPITEDIVFEDERLAAPFVMYDRSQDKLMVFFIYSSGNNGRNCLIFMEVQVTALRQTPEDISSSRSEIFVPYLLWGYYDETIRSRGIRKSKSEEVNRAVLGSTKFFTRPEEELRLLDNIPIQRIAGLISFDGYYRIFFRDDNGNIRSMISSDTGKTWIVDEARPGVDAILSGDGDLDLQTVIDEENSEFFDEIVDLEDGAYEEDEFEDFS